MRLSNTSLALRLSDLRTSYSGIWSFFHPGLVIPDEPLLRGTRVEELRRRNGESTAPECIENRPTRSESQNDSARVPRPIILLRSKQKAI